MSIHSCHDCYYANPHYNQNGVIVGVDCSADNMRFIEYEYSSCMRCGRWAERDD